MERQALPHVHYEVTNIMASKKSSVNNDEAHADTHTQIQQQASKPPHTLHDQMEGRDGNHAVGETDN